MVWLVSPDLEGGRERERETCMVEEMCCGRLEKVDERDGRARIDEGEGRITEGSGGWRKKLVDIVAAKKD